MRSSIFRKTAALMPLSLTLPAVILKTTEPFDLFLSYTILLFLSLDAPGAFRNAAAAEPGIRKVDARFFGSLIQFFLGVILLFCLSFTILKEYISFSITVSASLLMFEQLFEERLFSIGRKSDAHLLSIVNAILCASGVFLHLTPVFCAVSLLISFSVTLANTPFRKHTPIFSIFHIPLSLLKDTLIPGILCSMVISLKAESAFALVGWGIARVCRTFARCNSDETRRPRFILSIVLVICTIISVIQNQIDPVLTVSSAILLSLSVFFSIEWKTIIVSLLFILTPLCLYIGYPLAAFIPAIASCIVSYDKRILLRKV